MKKYTVLFCEWNSICEKGIEKAFQNLGFEADYLKRRFTSVDFDKEYLNILANMLQKKKYDCVFSINFMPIISRTCNLFKIPYICWTSDNPCFQLFSETVKYPNNRIFLFDYAQYEQFHKENPENIYYLPLGCDPDSFNHIELSSEDHKLFDCSISFIGSTYVEQCIYNSITDMPDYLRGYCEGIIASQLQVYGMNFIKDALSPAFCQEFKKCANWIPLTEDYVEDVPSIIADTYLGMKCTEQERLLTLRNISEHHTLDFYTQSDVSQLPKINYRGPADSVTMMPKIFKCSKINLNMTSKTIKTGLPLRIFDIMCAGGFLLTNFQAEIPDYFEIGKDLAIYESQDDLLNKIDYYLNHDDLRQEIAHRGQQKVLKEHTYTIRLSQIFETVFETN